MKRSRDDAIKQPFGSTSEECSSNVRPRPCLRNCPNAGKNGATSKRKPTMNDAWTYLKKVKETFPDQKKDKCLMFLNLMNDFKNKRIDTVGVIAIVKDLFKDHPDLLLGFNVFLPKGYEMNLSSYAFNLLKNIEKRFENAKHVYESFKNIMLKYRSENRDINEVHHEVSVLLKDHPDLLDEFRKFMPYYIKRA